MKIKFIYNIHLIFMILIKLKIIGLNMKVCFKMIINMVIIFENKDMECYT